MDRPETTEQEKKTNNKKKGSILEFNLPGWKELKNFSLFKRGGAREQTRDVNTSLFLVYLAFITAWGDKLLPADVVTYLDNHRLGQLVTGIFIILFSLEIFTNDDMNTIETIVYTFLIFIAYIITSKQSPTFFIITLGLLTINYFIDKSIRLNNKGEKEFISIRMDILEKIYKIVNISIVLMVLLGGSFYIHKQYIDHRSESSNIVMFLFKYFLEGSQRHYGNAKRVFATPK